MIVMTALLRPVLATVLAVAALAVPANAQQPPGEQKPSTDVHEHVAVTAPLLTPTKEASGRLTKKPGEFLKTTHERQ